MTRPLVITDTAFRVPRDGRDGRPGTDGRDGADGEPGMKWTGIFSRRTTYKPGDVVGFEKSSYVCIQETHSREPDRHPAHWQPVAKQGERGPAGKNETTYIKQGSPRLVSAMAEIEELKQQLINGGGGGTVKMQAIFDSNTTAGAVVYVSGDGHVDLAQANPGNIDGATAVGIATADVLAGQTGDYIPVGPITVDTWNLTPGTVYYLSPDVPGGMTTTYPDNPGEFVIILGAAATSTQLNINIHYMVEQGDA
jgi:hypothetical protein